MAQPQPAHADDPHERLQKMLSMVLVQTGRAFAPAAKHNPLDLERLNSGLRITYTAALSKFHETLDEFEDELCYAKTVMRRDLALCRAERAKREEAAAAEHVAVKPAAPAADAHAAMTMGGGPDGGDRDVTMADATVSQPTAAPEDNQDAVKVDAAKSEDQAPANPAQDTTKQGDANNTAEQADSKTEAAAAEDEAMQDMNLDTSFDDLFDTAPSTANKAEFDFDSMFADTAGDSMAGGGENSRENPDSQLDFTLGGDNQDPVDVSSLLPGLESYANINETSTDTVNQETDANNPISASDFNFLDLQSSNSDPPPKPAESQAQAEQPGLSAAAGGDEPQENMGDNSFNDLFDFSDFNMDNAAGGGEDSTEFDDLFSSLNG